MRLCCEMGFFGMRNRPFRRVIWAISEHEMGFIGVRNGAFRETEDWRARWSIA